MASLITQAQRLLPEAVAQARDQELTWDEIGQLLGVSGSTDRTPLPTHHPRTHQELNPCPPRRPFPPQLPSPQTRAAPQPMSRLTEGHPKGLALTPARISAP